jgi:hypothetical protein
MQTDKEGEVGTAEIDRKEQTTGKKYKSGEAEKAEGERDGEGREEPEERKDGERQIKKGGR